MNLESQPTGRLQGRGLQTEALLSQRFALDQQLEQLRQEVTILFSDIVGYTKYVHRHGDVEGRLLQERHQHLLLPFVTRHGGVFVKSIGDALMVRFEHAGAAVEAACGALRWLRQENESYSQSEHLHLRIGIASGRALIEANDVNGEVVNLSARLCKLANVDDIMISDRAVQQLDHYLAGLCIPQAQVAVRGMEETSVRAFRVIWDQETPARGLSTQQDVLVLEVSREGERLKQSLHIEGTGRDTVSHYEYLPWKPQVVEKACQEITQALKRANIVQSQNALDTLVSAGAALYDVLLTSSVKKQLSEEGLEYLVLRLQDSLVFIPWELLYDGRQFLCRRFALGRQVTSRQPAEKARPRWSLRPRVSIVSDPRGNLSSAAREGRELLSQLESSDRLSVAMKTGASMNYVRKELRRSALVHFCGHAEYDDEDPRKSGWILADGKLTGDDVLQMAESEQALPAVVFANACQSGRAEDWSPEQGKRLYGLASSFLLAGVQHYVGTFWDVLDVPSRRFAEKFYAALLQGVPIGKAVQQAREALAKRGGEEALIWASYMLYGNPAVGMFGVPDVVEPEKIDEIEATSSTEEQAGTSEANESRLASTVTRTGSGDGAGSLRKVVTASILAALLAVLVVLGAGRLIGAPRPPTESTPPTSDTLALVNQLGARLNDPAYRKRLGEEDRWTSRPLTVAVMPFQIVEEASAPGDSAIEEQVRKMIYRELAEAPGMTLIERERIEQLLEEQQIGSSDLADPVVMARLGRLKFARLFLTGTIAVESGGMQLSFHLYDTESSQIVAPNVVTDEDSPSSLASRVALDVLSGVQREYPLRGRILELSDDEVFLNIGADTGVGRGQTYSVLAEPDNAKLRGKGLLKKIGAIQATEVGAQACAATVISQEHPFEVEMKVEIAGSAGSDSPSPPEQGPVPSDD